MRLSNNYDIHNNLLGKRTELISCCISRIVLEYIGVAMHTCIGSACQI